MKKFFKYFCVAMLGVAAIVGCKKDDNTDDGKKDEAVAPIIMNVVMPSEANALPGTDVTIQGVGFMEGDVIDCLGQDGQGDFKPVVKSVSKSGITIAVPEDAKGHYKVKVTRNGKSTELTEILFIPAVIKLDNVVVPTAVVHWGETLTITATGIKATDKVVIESENYEDVELDNVAAENKIEFTVPNTLYGANTFKIKRDGDLAVLGTVKIGAVAFTAALGGVVFYVSDDGLHGLVVHPECIVPAATAWGPSIPMDPFYAGTEDGIYKGASNTEKLVKQFNDAEETGNYPYSGLDQTKTNGKSPAVIASELVAGGYDDWFIPSKAELIELFKVKATLAEKELFVIPANNYWTSLEFTEEAPSWDWAMWYVNFYEATDIVTWCAPKDTWYIGAMAMRMF